MPSTSRTDMIPLFNNLVDMDSHVTLLFKTAPEVHIKRLDKWTKELLSVAFEWNTGMYADWSIDPIEEITKVFPAYDPKVEEVRGKAISGKVGVELEGCIQLLREDMSTRRAYIFSPDYYWEGPACNLIYQFLLRGGEMRLFVYMRSADYLKKFSYDLATAVGYLSYVSGKIGAKPGSITFFIASLHIYEGDTKDSKVLAKPLEVVA